MTKKKLTPFQHQGHKLRTRRDFLAQGYISAAAFTMAPSFLTLLSQRAYAQECGGGGGGGASGIPFVCFDLAGGANIAGSNVMVGKQGGQNDFLANYTTLGLPTDMNPQTAGVNSELGLAFHPDSAILRGILATTADTTRANVDGVLFAASSGDDTRNNPHNPMYWINAAGQGGKLVPTIGTSGSASGGKASAPASSVNPLARPAEVTGPNDVLGLVDLGTLANILDAKSAEMIMAAAGRLSESKLAAFNAQTLPEQVRDLMKCGYIQSSNMINEFSADRLDPRQDTAITAAFADMTDAGQQRTASIAKLALDGLAGAGTVELGGFDYHNGSRATGEQRDEDAGRMIGMTLEAAANKNQDVMIYVFSDGGVTSNGSADNSANGRGKGVWTGDSGQRSAAFVLVYSRDGRPPIRNDLRQIGSFRDNGAVETSATRVSNDVESLTKAIVANYLALSGEEGKLASVVGDNPFGADLDQYLAFAKLR